MADEASTSYIIRSNEINMVEQPYNKRESDILFKNLDEKFDRLFKKLDDQDKTLSRIETNQTDAQSRITRLEDTVKDYDELKLSVDGLTNYKYWIIGAIAAFGVLSAILVYLVNDKIDSKITSGIDQAFNTRFSKVQVINNNN